MTVETFTTRDLADSQLDRIRRGDTSNVATELVVREFNLVEDNATADWYDARHPNTDSKTEVKSCLSTVGNATTRDGRFRLWKEQLRSLSSAEARGTAYVAFVLYRMDDREIDVRRVKPQTVTEWVADRGGWNRSGHSEFDRQHKLPWPVVFE